MGYILKGLCELPDYNKISFPDMPPIPLEEVVPDTSPEVMHHFHIQQHFQLIIINMLLQAVGLLKEFLVYDSSKRTSAAQVSHVQREFDRSQ